MTLGTLKGGVSAIERYQIAFQSMRMRVWQKFEVRQPPLKKTIHMKWRWNERTGWNRESNESKDRLSHSTTACKSETPAVSNLVILSRDTGMRAGHLRLRFFEFLAHDCVPEMNFSRHICLHMYVLAGSWCDEWCNVVYFVNVHSSHYLCSSLFWFFESLRAKKWNDKKWYFNVCVYISFAVVAKIWACKIEM